MHFKIEQQGEEVTYCEVETRNLQIGVDAIKNLIKGDNAEITVLQFGPKEFELKIKPLLNTTDELLTCG